MSHKTAEHNSVFFTKTKYVCDIDMFVTVAVSYVLFVYSDNLHYA